MAARCQIRPATPADTARLAELERICFTDPWSPAGIREMLSAAHTVGLVARIKETIVGYAMARWAADTGEILNLAVAPEHRRAGIAVRLIDGVIKVLAEQGVGEVYLEVRESNAAARLLYQGRGFTVAGMRRAYYRHPTEDALVLRLPLDGPA
jgi:ribosomal-protein-alanine N-acetyltransferase